MAEHPVNLHPRSIERQDQWTQVVCKSADDSRSSIKKPPVKATQSNKIVAPPVRTALEIAPGKEPVNRHPVRQHFPAPSTSSCVTVANATKLTRNEANLSVICSNVPESNSASLKDRNSHDLTHWQTICDTIKVSAKPSAVTRLRRHPD